MDILIDVERYLRYNIKTKSELENSVFLYLYPYVYIFEHEMIMLKYVSMFLEKYLTEHAEKFLIFISWLGPQWTLISYICVFFLANEVLFYFLIIKHGEKIRSM